MLLTKDITMATDLPVTFNKDQTAAFVQYLEAIIQADGKMWDYRTMMEAVDVAYQRETDSSEETVQAAFAKARGDIKKIRNVEIPIVKPQVEAAVTYLSSVFLTGYPIFGVTSGPKTIDIAQQWNTLMIDNSIRGKWVRNLQMFFRDGVKYNLHGLHVYWDKKTTYEPETLATSAKAAQRKTLWEDEFRCRNGETNERRDFKKVVGVFAGYNIICTGTITRCSQTDYCLFNR